MTDMKLTDEQLSRKYKELNAAWHLIKSGDPATLFALDMAEFIQRFIVSEYTDEDVAEFVKAINTLGLRYQDNRRMYDMVLNLAYSIDRSIVENRKREATA